MNNTLEDHYITMGSMASARATASPSPDARDTAHRDVHGVDNRLKSQLPPAVRMVTQGDGLNGPRPNKRESASFLELQRDVRVLNRQPFKRKLNMEAVLRENGAQGIDELEELRMEQEYDVSGQDAGVGEYRPDGAASQGPDLGKTAEEARSGGWRRGRR